MTSPQPGSMASGRAESGGPEPAGQPASTDAAVQPAPSPADARKPEVTALPMAGTPQRPSATPPPAPATVQLQGSKLPWKDAADGTTVFRLGTQFVIWWLWVAFAIFNVFELALRDRDYFSIEVVVALLTITGVAYACTVRPKVTADSDGVFVRNPFRDHRVPWGAVKGVFLGDSVEFECARPAPKKDKTIYCWGLYSGRRRRMRQQMQRSFLSFRPQPSSRAPAEAHELSRTTTVQVMATELGRRAKEAKDQGAPEGVLESGWCWPALAAALIPAAALLALLVAR